MRIVSEPVKFVWDEGNIEAEEIFADPQRKIFKDKLHSSGEERFRVVGKTDLGRLLFVVFTIRQKKVRVISARDINRKEVFLYEEKINSAKI